MECNGEDECCEDLRWSFSADLLERVLTALVRVERIVLAFPARTAVEQDGDVEVNTRDEPRDIGRRKDPKGSQSRDTSDDAEHGPCATLQCMLAFAAVHAERHEELLPDIDVEQDDEKEPYGYVDAEPFEWPAPERGAVVCFELDVEDREEETEGGDA